MRFPQAALVLVLLAPAGVGGEGILEIESSQTEIGYLSAEEAARFRLLSQEYEINFGADKGLAADDAGRLLVEVAREDVPRVIENIRGSRTGDEEAARRSVAAALAGQAEVLLKIRSLINVSLDEITGEMLAERARVIADRQRALGSDSREAAAGTLGKQTEELSAEEKSTLEDLREDQDALAAQVAQLHKAARRTAREQGQESRLAAHVRSALREGRLDEAGREMEEASQSLAKNRIARAIARQDEAAGSLESFARALESAQGPREPPETLRELIASQQDITERTGKAAAQDDFQDLSRRQEELRDRTRELAAAVAEKPAASAFLEGAGEAMDQAREALARAEADKGPAGGQKQKALAGQGRATEFLLAAGKALDDPTLDNLFAAIQDATAETARQAGELEALSDVLDEQKRLKEETDSSLSQPPRLNALAPRQEKLEKSLADASAAAGQPPSAESPPAQRAAGPETQAAQAAMSRASEALKNSQGQEAARNQQQAIDALEDAGERLADTMTARGEDLESMLEAAGKASTPQPLPEAMEEALDEARRTAGSLEAAAEASRLASEEQSLADESRGMESSQQSQLAAAAEAQEKMARKAEQMAQAQGASQQFAQAASDARGEMAEAAEELRRGRPAPAAGRMKAAASHLRAAAAAALTDAATRGQQPSSHSASPAGGIGMSRSARGAATGGKPEDAAWLARLPADASPEMVQAAQGVFPRGYEEVLRKYYEVLAKENTRK